MNGPLLPFEYAELTARADIFPSWIGDTAILAAVEYDVLDKTAVTRTFLLNCHVVYIRGINACSGGLRCK
jgi:hypothetical protein